MNLPSPPTALSPGVKHLICCVGCQVANLSVSSEKESETKDANISNKSAANADRFVSSICALDLDSIASLFPASDDSAEYFEAAVRVLAPVLAQSHDVFTALSKEQIESVLMPRLQWTHSQKVFQDCCELLWGQQEDGATHILVLLLISSVLERALGNVYLLKGSQCPSMLKDLLVTEELTTAVGLPMIQILRVVIGPPTSLNLRNVAWHGFLGDQELSARYCSFLVLLAASVGDILARQGLPPIPQRPFFTFTPEGSARLCSALQLSEGVVTMPDIQCLGSVLRASGVILPQTDQQWTLALQLYSQGRYGYCLALLLPLLEHVLRRLFASVNNCPHRVLTAESSTLYTTLNEILDQTLPDGSPNKLPEFLTTPCMDLLHDLLMYPEGPRVRDHLSHGEVDYGSVGQGLVWSVLHVVVFTALRLSPQAHCSTSCRDMEKRVQSYRSVFHPVAVLQHKFAGLLGLLEKTESLELDSICKTLLGEGGEGCDDQWSDNALLTRTEDTLRSLQHWAPFCDITHNHGQDLQLGPLKRIAQNHIPTLFRWQQTDGQTDGQGAMKERECVGVLQRVVEECSTAAQQLQHTLQQRMQQLQAKQLRSRHRDNLRRLVLCMPCLQLLMSAVCGTVGWSIERLPHYSCLSSSQCRLMHKFLKSSLQQCENLRTLTSTDKNKWTESVDLLTQWVTTCDRFLQDWHKQQQHTDPPPS